MSSRQERGQSLIITHREVAENPATRHKKLRHDRLHLNNEMLSLGIHVGYEGIDHCRIFFLHNTLTRVIMFSAMSPPSYYAGIAKFFFETLLFKKPHLV